MNVSIALDPTEIAPVVLESDAVKPEDSRPTFFARFLTCREVLKRNKILNEAANEKDDEAHNAKLNEVLSLHLAGWKNVTDRDGKPIEFGIERLDDIGTPAEKWELALACGRAISLTESAKKKARQDQQTPGSRSDWAPASGPGSSASTAQPVA